QVDHLGGNTLGLERVGGFCAEWQRPPVTDHRQVAAGLLRAPFAEGYEEVRSIRPLRLPRGPIAERRIDQLAQSLVVSRLAGDLLARLRPHAHQRLRN